MPSRIVDENPSHNLRGDRKEVSAIFPTDSPCVHQAKIRFIHQGSGLERPLPALSSHLPMSNPPELLVHQGSKPGQGSLVSPAPSLKERAYLRKLLLLRAVAWFHWRNFASETDFLRFHDSSASPFTHKQMKGLLVIRDEHYGNIDNRFKYTRIRRPRFESAPRQRILLRDGAGHLGDRLSGLCAKLLPCGSFPLAPA